MHINFTGHQVDVTDALRQLTSEKMEKLERHFDRITNINVTFTVEKLRHIANATVSIAGGEIHASDESDDMYKAIDGLVDKLDRQLLKHKEKIKDHKD